MKKKVEEDELTEEEAKVDEKKSRRESVEKRKARKKIDRVARFAGLILLFVVVIVGFLLWVAGEM